MVRSTPFSKHTKLLNKGSLAYYWLNCQTNSVPDSPEQQADTANLDELFMDWEELEARDQSPDHLDFTDATLAKANVEELLDDLDATQSETATIAVAVGGVGVANSSDEASAVNNPFERPKTAKPRRVRNSLSELDRELTELGIAPYDTEDKPEDTQGTSQPAAEPETNEATESETVTRFLDTQPPTQPKGEKKRKATEWLIEKWEGFRRTSTLTKLAMGVGAVSLLGIGLPAIISSANDRQAEGLSLKSDGDETPATVIFENAAEAEPTMSITIETSTTTITITPPEQTTPSTAALIPPIELERGGEQREITEEEGVAAIAAHEVYVAQLRQDALDKLAQFTPEDDAAFREMYLWSLEHPEAAFVLNEG